jgi:branched-chain amino acid transport system permease protein
MANILQLLVDGLVFSCIVILASIGLSLVYSIADFANFAHGDTMTLGAFGGLVGAAVLSDGWTVAVPFTDAAFELAVPFPDVVLFSIPLSLFGGLVVGMVVTAAVVVATQRFVYRPLGDVGSIELLITSIGVALVYRAVVQILFGSILRGYDVVRRGAIDWIAASTGVAITPRSVVVVVLTAVLVVSLHALLQYTTLGRKMRATADNPDLARVAGIRTDEVITAMWILGGALAAAGGVFLGIQALQVRPRMGFDVLLIVFSAVILGGIGSVYGAMLGGLVIGMAINLTPAIPFVPIEYQSAVAFVLMVVILLVRPRGIMGEAV